MFRPASYRFASSISCTLLRMHHAVYVYSCGVTYFFKCVPFVALESILWKLYKIWHKLSKSSTEFVKKRRKHRMIMIIVYAARDTKWRG